MKKSTIILISLVIFVVAIFSTLPFLCHKAEYKREDYIGVYYYDLVKRHDHTLDYIILYQDSTFYHKASDGHIERGKWKYVKYKNMEDIYFDESISCSKGCYSSTLSCSPDKLSFEIDLDVDFYRVDSVKARQMGITAENVIWDMGTREDNIFTQLYDCSMCCANIGFYFLRIIMFAITAKQE